MINIFFCRAAQKKREMKKEEQQYSEFLQSVVYEVIDHKSMIEVSPEQN